MRYTQIILSLTFLCLWSTTHAEEPDWNMFTVKNEITELKRRVDLAEKEIKTLKTNWNMFASKSAESKSATAGCPCPEGGSCICPADGCDCSGCPLHNQKTHITWAGKPNANGRSAKLTCSDDCPPCQVTKRDLHDVSTNITVENFANIEAAGNAGYDQLPWVRLIENGRTVKMLAGGSCTAERIKEWLSGSTPAVTKAAPRIAYATPAPPRGKPVVRAVQRAPSVSYAANRGPGHTHRCGRCGTSWSHENWNVGNPAAHTCPGCGSLTWGNRTEGWSAPARSAPARRSAPVRTTFQPRVMFSAGGSFCPTCPR